MDENENVKAPWWQKAWVIVLSCIFVPPAGIVLLWLYPWTGKKANRIIITVFLAFYTLFWFGSIVGGGSKPSANQEQPSTQTQTQAETTTENTDTKAEPVAQTETKTGINAEAFISAVNSFADTFNSQESGVTITPKKIDVSDTGTTATVNFYLGDLAAWSVSDDTSKKEFINTVGQTLNSMAAANCYDSKSTVGATVILSSPSGLKLGEYTIWGNVKLEN